MTLKRHKLHLPLSLEMILAITIGGVSGEVVGYCTKNIFPVSSTVDLGEEDVQITLPDYPPPYLRYFAICCIFLFETHKPIYYFVFYLH